MTTITPGLEINEFFALQTSLEVPEQPAYIFGAAAHLTRYAISSEREAGRLTAYDPVGTYIEGTFRTAFSWPGKPAGSTIDQSYTKLYAKSALLRYYQNTSQTAVRIGTNGLKLSGVGFAANGAYAKSAAIIDRGVAVGDAVLVRGLANSVPFALRTRVIGLTGNAVAAVVGAPVVVSTNAVERIGASAVVTTAAGTNVGNITAAGSATAYDGVADGAITETYTVTVIQASTGGNATTARFRVTSASGTDDQSSVTPAAFAAATSIGTRGLVATWTRVSGELTVGESWTFAVSQQYARPTPVVAGTYTGTTARVYILEVLTGGQTDESPRVRIMTQVGEDQVGPYTLTEASAGVTSSFNLGSKGLTCHFTATNGLMAGDKWLISATPAGIGELNTLMLAHTFPDGTPSNTTAELEFDLCVVRDVEVPKKSLTAGVYNWTTSDTQLHVNAGIQLKQSDILLTGVSATLTLTNSSTSTDSLLYVHYRAWLQRSVGYGSVSDSASLDVAAPGATHPDNPLRQHLVKAMASAGGRPVKYFRVGDPAVEANWSAALAAVDDTREVYGLVPVTENPTLLSLVAAHVESRSGPRYNLRRVSWLALPIYTTAAVLRAANTTSGTPALATITDDPSTTGTQYTLVTFDGAQVDLLALGVRAGDRLLYSYVVDGWGEETYSWATVDAVLTAVTLRLTTSTVNEVVPRRVEIWRDLSPSEQVADLQARAAAYGRRTRLVVCGNVEDGAVTHAGTAVAAALAAQSSAAAPHQPLTRQAINGFTAAPQLRRFSFDELDDIASAGIWLIGEVVSTGQLVTRHAVTAGNYDNVNEREESVQRNADSCLGYLYSRLNPLIGGGNVTNTMLAHIESVIISAAGYLKTANKTPELGGQLLDDGDGIDILTRPRKSPAFKDTVLIQLAFNMPGPLNRLIVDAYFR